MTGSDLYGIVYDWATLVLNTELAMDLPIIQSRQNIPAPASFYLAIPPSPNTTDIGYGIHSPYDESRLGAEVAFSQGREASMTIREIGGTGETLRILGDSLNRQSIRDFFREHNCSVLRKGSVQEIPNLVEDLWSEEYVLEIIFNIEQATGEETTYIETVEFINEIKGE